MGEANRQRAAKKAQATRRRRLRDATPLERARMKLRDADRRADMHRLDVERAVKKMAEWNREVQRLRRRVERLEDERAAKGIIRIAMMRTFTNDHGDNGLTEPMAWLLVWASLYPRAHSGAHLSPYWADIVKLAKMLAVDEGSYSVEHVKDVMASVVTLQRRVHDVRHSHY